MADYQISLDALLAFCDEGLCIQAPGKLMVFEGPEDDWIHYVPRLLVLLEGRTLFRYHNQGKLCEKEIQAPALLYCAREGWLTYVSDTNPIRSLSFSFYPSYIRAMHIDYDGIHKPPTARDVFFHTGSPLSAAGLAILNAVEKLHEGGKDSIAQEFLFPLLECTVSELRDCTTGKVVQKVRKLWDQINTFLRSHRDEPVSRAQLAQLFRISPGYVSEICKQYTGESYSRTKSRYQLEHAENLLLHTRFNVEEIALQSGFSSANYFIRSFRKEHGLTPHVFRNQQAKS